MTKRYASALEEIRSLLASRSQADPMLDARDVWEELTCYPVPSRRTVRRLIEQIRAEGEYGHRGQYKVRGQGGQTKPSNMRLNYKMTHKEIRQRIEELDRRATAYEARSVEIGADLCAALDAAAAEQGTTRHHVATFAMRKYLAQHPEMLRPTDSPTH